ncbi:hypothetical protein F4678DRAFT_19347 [Xylaria arbuscula]|nr:hypothetical protein F4678DRAFT_19347 [Xylaria arbuscula]
MPISREPSQRALAWVKWNSSKTSLNSNHNSKRANEPEIVHLGGARVGTAFEVLDLPAPDRSRPAERPLTQWAFNPPPPNPPGIGIAIACPDDSPGETPGAFHFDDERPITQWFPELQPEDLKRKNDSHHLSPTTAYSHMNSSASNTDDALSSPLSPSPSSNATYDSPASASPLQSPATPPLEFPETNPVRPVQFPKRSTSLSQSSRYTPSTTRRTAGNRAVQEKESQLRRTQSNAEVPRGTEWKAPPSQLVFRETKDSLHAREASPHELKIREPHRTSPKPAQIIQDVFVLPPLTSAPPNVPLPPISATKLAGQGKARDQLHRRGPSSSSDRGIERSPAPEPHEQEDAQQSGSEHKLTSKERFWLHRHYRGEAMFLKAWGLQISSEEDREEGRGILRELMEREAEEEKASQEKQRMHHRSGSLSRSSTTTVTSSRDGAGLDVIAEERLSREFHIRPNGSLSDVDRTDENFWKVNHGTGDQRPRRLHGSEKHSRNESTDSVLEQYLDLRLNNNN